MKTKLTFEYIVRAVIGLLWALLFQTTSKAAKCHVSISGIALRGQTVSSLSAVDILVCFTNCEKTPGCRSVNYYLRRSLCELNNGTIEKYPFMKVQDGDSTYFQILKPLQIWSSWSSWEPCDCGITTRTRTCKIDACEGTSLEKKNCNMVHTTITSKEGKPCALPFKYKGVCYKACTDVDWSAKWCSYHTVYQGSWGYCP